MKPVAPYQRFRRQPAGFTFTEVLFAMMIMGIGFIMLAAMFPVAVRQVQASVEDASGAAVGQSAVRMIGQHATAANLPANNAITTFPASVVPPLARSSATTRSARSIRTLRLGRTLPPQYRRRLRHRLRLLPDVPQFLHLYQSC